jgi:ABC-type hemin transport system substrate-binding protein
LAKEHLLNRIDIFVIEWHEKGPSDIVSMLKAAGFTVLSLDGNAVNHGMIYAWKD